MRCYGAGRRARGQQGALFPGQVGQFGQRLRPGQHQQGVFRPVVLVLEGVQGRLEGRALQRQAVSVASMEAGGRMVGGQAGGQGQVSAGIGAVRPGDEFGMQHLALAALGVRCQQGRGEHVQ